MNGKRNSRKIREFRFSEHKCEWFLYRTHTLEMASKKIKRTHDDLLDGSVRDGQVTVVRDVDKAVIKATTVPKEEEPPFISRDRADFVSRCMQLPSSDTKVRILVQLLHEGYMLDRWVFNVMPSTVKMLDEYNEEGGEAYLTELAEAEDPEFKAKREALLVETDNGGDTYPMLEEWLNSHNEEGTATKHPKTLEDQTTSLETTESWWKSLRRYEAVFTWVSSDCL